MIRGRLVSGVFCLVGFLGINGCQHQPAQEAADTPATQPVIAERIVTTAVATIRPSQAATTQPTDNNVIGTVKFTQTADGVSYVADIDGFAPGSKHGFHIHDKGDLSAPNLSSAGGHFNPTHESHGGPMSEHHHLGDLGNLEADANGHAHKQGSISGVTLNGQGPSIIGKSVIVHAKVDDLKSQPAGDSGARIAGGVIRLNP
jgi:Cu-Zn family superoxide dismutase